MAIPFERDVRNDRPLREVVTEIKEEVRDFAATRIEMLKVEMNEKLARLKASLPMLAAAAVFALGAFGALTYALIATAATLIGGDWAWAIGGAIVFGLYALLGGVLGWMGYKEISTEGLAPQRTLRVLRQDHQWLQNEARRSA